MYVDWLVSRDGTGLLITAKMEHSDYTLQEVARRRDIYRAIRDMAEEKKSAGALEVFHVAGRGAMEVTFSEDAHRDKETFIPLVLLVVLSTLYFIYRSIRGVVLPFAVVVVSVIWTLGLMAIVEIPVYFTTTMMTVVLMAIAVAYGNHILSRYYDEIVEHREISSTECEQSEQLEEGIKLS